MDAGGAMVHTARRTFYDGCLSVVGIGKQQQMQRLMLEKILFELGEACWGDGNGMFSYQPRQPLEDTVFL
jgi:hypothetical protein